jgi:hypothetical protein
MPKRIKSANSAQLNVQPELGIDYTGPAASIPDNALRASENGYYPAGAKKWRSRPGVTCVLTEANKLPGSIQVMRPHYNGTTTYMVVAANNELYHLTSAQLAGVAASRIPTKIGDLSAVTGVDNKPGLATFNTTLFIADKGSATMRYWNAGGTYGNVTGGPPYPSCVMEARNRLWSNSTTDKDAVYGSPSEWTTTNWSVTGNGNVVLRAGYGDGMRVVAMSYSLGGKSEVLISKRNSDDGASHIRRLSIADATPANWSISDPFCQVGPQDNAYSMLQAYNDVLFFSDDGLYNVAAVQSYDDLQIGNVGDKINPLIRNSGVVQVKEMAQLPLLGCVAVFIDSSKYVYVYTPWNRAFTRWSFGDEIVTTSCTIGETTYFGTEAGRIYALNPDDEARVSVGYDELEYGVLTSFNSMFRTKSFTFLGYDALIRRTTALVTPLTSGDGTVHAVNGIGATSLLFDWSQTPSAILVGGAQAFALTIGGSYAQTTPIGRGTGTSEYLVEYGGPRDESISFQLSMGNGARGEVQYISADVRANLGG